MKKASTVIVLALLAYYAINNVDVPGSAERLPVPQANSSSRIVEAYKNREYDVQVRGEGTVSRVLSDDNDGSRHQRFILEIAPGQTVLVAHNIDLAPRVAGISVGDAVEFYGVYEWNERGGVIHWTHHDPRGQHVGGWLKHRGQTYQ